MMLFSCGPALAPGSQHCREETPQWL